jgi:hypothetical protein
MLPYNSDIDPGEWRAEFEAWKQSIRDARDAQSAAARSLTEAQQTLGTLATWRDQLGTYLNVMLSRLPGYDAANATIDGLTRALVDLDGEVSDHEVARDTATARLVGGPATDRSVILLPVRVHTAWRQEPQQSAPANSWTLLVRILPSELHTDRHDPRLSPLEQTLARAYWATSELGGPYQTRQAWVDLTRRAPPQRAAWIVHNTDPNKGVAPATREHDLDPQVTLRLLPDRFAVVLLSAGEPVNTATPGSPPTFISWAQPIPTPELSVPLLHTPAETPWTVDFDTAVATGMGLRIAVSASTPAIDELVVIGLRPGSTPADLADLLRDHVYSAGAELMTDGAPTNNSATDRTPRTDARDRDALFALANSVDPGPGPAGSAGQQLADLLGIPAATAALLPGAATDRAAVPTALAVMVEAAVTGSLIATLPATAGVTSQLAPSGHAPTLRVGKQPFGILPTLTPRRWAAGPDPIDQVLAAAVHVAALRQTRPLDVDPLSPTPTPIMPRQVTTADDSALTDILAEAASSLTWSDGTSTWTGLDQLVGPAEGPGSPATYLTQLANPPLADEVIAAAGQSLLGAIALAAHSIAAAPAALNVLAATAAQENGRATLARLLTDQLDVCSHRLDAWVTAAANRRRATQLGNPAVIGAYGYLTNVAPRGAPRSFGHVHAPSLGHAATAAVLRSGYLGQRRAAWATRVAAAVKAGDLAAIAAARAGLAALSPLEPAAEDALPLAIDLSSGRVRAARWVLAATRQGQPLAAVLGHQVERALVEADLQTFLAPLRKLTRFPTGSALEGLEFDRAQKQTKLAQDEGELTRRRAAVAAADLAVQQAQQRQVVAQAARNAAATAWLPYANLITERVNVQSQLDAANATLAQLQGNRPTTTSHNVSVRTP